LSGCILQHFFPRRLHDRRWWMVPAVAIRDDAWAVPVLKRHVTGGPAERALRHAGQTTPGNSRRRRELPSDLDSHAAHNRSGKNSGGRPGPWKLEHRSQKWTAVSNPGFVATITRGCLTERTHRAQLSDGLWERLVFHSTDARREQPRMDSTSRAWRNRPPASGRSRTSPSVPSGASRALSRTLTRDAPQVAGAKPRTGRLAEVGPPVANQVVSESSGSSPSSERLGAAFVQPVLDARTRICQSGLLDRLGQRKHGASNQKSVRLLSSCFLGREPVIFFDYSNAASLIGDRDTCGRVVDARDLPTGMPKMYFAHSSTVHTYNCVVNTVKNNGFSQTQLGKQEDLSGGKWSLLWGGHLKPEQLRAFRPSQCTNHFPYSWQLGRKDLMWKNMSKMKRKFPRDFDITPASFVFPEDLKSWETERDSNPKALWILKPTSSSCGRGIKILSRDSTVSPKKSAVVQRYLHQPLLLNGYKFDLRVYVVVTSLDPLKVYLNSEGLVRIATQKYTCSPKSLGARTMHLTNYSVNKHSELYVKNMDLGGSVCLSPTPSCSASRQGQEDDEEEEGLSMDEEQEAISDEDGEEKGGVEERFASKWDFADLKAHLIREGYDWSLIWGNIEEVAVKAMMAVEPALSMNWHKGTVPDPRTGASTSTCFEVYGFDIMIDDKLKAWLLEVNVSPSLSSSSPLDKRIKTKLIADTLTLVGLRPVDHKQVDKDLKAQHQSRLLGLDKSPSVIKSRNAHVLQAAKSCAEFSEADWELIMDTHDEYMRRGCLERVYPRLDMVGRCSEFLFSQRYSNVLLAKWLSFGGPKLFEPGHRDQLPANVRMVEFHKV